MDPSDIFRLMDSQHSTEELLGAYVKVNVERDAKRRDLLARLIDYYNIPKDHPFPVSRLYHQYCKTHDGRRSQISFDELDDFYKNLRNKSYPGAEKIMLAEGLPALKMGLEQTILARRSVRDYSGEPITLDEVSKLLGLSYGITDKEMSRRAAPSAGALYTVEIYPIALDIRGLSMGVYHYLPAEHALEYVRPFDLPDIKDTIWDRSSITQPALVLVFTAVLSNVQAKYGERGYRYAFVDAGHIAQNMSLAATAMDLGSVCLGGFDDDLLDNTIGVDGNDEATIYCAALGRPKKVPKKSE